MVTLRVIQVIIAFLNTNKKECLDVADSSFTPKSFCIGMVVYMYIYPLSLLIQMIFILQ